MVQYTPIIWRFPEIGVPQIIHFNRIFHYKPSILGGNSGNLHIGPQSFSISGLGRPALSPGQQLRRHQGDRGQHRRGRRDGRGGWHYGYIWFIEFIEASISQLFYVNWFMDISRILNWNFCFTKNDDGSSGVVQNWHRKPPQGPIHLGWFCD